VEKYLNLVKVEAKTIPEAWWLCIKNLFEQGYEYRVERGSFAGQRRLEFDFVTIHIHYPGVMPLVPDVPLGVTPPTSIEFVESYLSYIMTAHKKEGEQYTYGQYLEKQIAEVIRMYKEEGYNTNQACMVVGDKDSIYLSDPPCLRQIDTRIRYGKLHFMVDFRSWDLWGGFPPNLAAIQLLKEYMASEIGVGDGELVANSKGLHLYEYVWSSARAVIQKKRNQTERT